VRGLAEIKKKGNSVSIFATYIKRIIIYGWSYTHPNSIMSTLTKLLVNATVLSEICYSAMVTGLLLFSSLIGFAVVFRLGRSD
jgi:hypothetical protein